MSDQSHPHLTFPDTSNQPSSDPQLPPADPPELLSPAVAPEDDTSTNIDATSATATNKGFMTTYIAGWAAMAVLAVAYLGTVAIYPDLLRANDPGTMMTEPEPNKGQRALANAPATASTSPNIAMAKTEKPAPEGSANTSPKPADSNEGKRTSDLPQFQHQNGPQAPVTVTAAEPAKVNMIEHPSVITTAEMLSGIETNDEAEVKAATLTATNEVAEKASTGPGPAPVVPKLISSAEPGENDQTETKSTEATAAPETAADVTVPPLPAIKPKLRAAKLAAEARRKAAEKQAEVRRKALEIARLEAERTTAIQRSGPPIVTGSIDKANPASNNAPISFGPAIIQDEPATIGVRLATGPNIDALRLSWDLLRTKHGAALNGLQPRYTVTEAAGGRRFGLVAGPLKTSDDARRVCLQMQASRVPCTPSTFTGNTL